MRPIVLLSLVVALTFSLDVAVARSPEPGPIRTLASTAKTERATVSVRNSRFGRVLTDGRGFALYLFTRDGKRNLSRCYGACAKAWPPLLTSGNPKAAGDAKSSLLGRTKRRDGKYQVTYAGQPLYYYVDDNKPGLILCHNVPEFGGVWLVLGPSGKARP